ncbi:CidA/LrgA family protein [Vagococcus elongatus]|uniref:Murein hydrolase regulator LrgA n=1 Tax=Vagococcus elongatus TaxID=180344 RepID=A0A430B408_9ENTE|nr:CidA/LrgA family protein [Vagococcus elongatus]RSU15054.1 hypothetical protein CBF29_01570 [Vagococcus elongatus]
MKILRELLIILLFTFLGKSLQVIFHLPIPGSVIGMIFLLAALVSGVVKERHVALVGDYLLEILSIFFLPAGVGLMLHFDLVKGSLLKLLLILFVTFVVSLFVVGRLSQWLKMKKEVTKVNITKEDVEHGTTIDE